MCVSRGGKSRAHLVLSIVIFWALRQPRSQEFLPMAQVRLSPLQKRILVWLWWHVHLAKDLTAANYPALLRALPTRAARTTASVRALEQKGFVTVRRSPDGQIQGVLLTEAGWERAHTLTLL